MASQIKTFAAVNRVLYATARNSCRSKDRTLSGDSFHDLPQQVVTSQGLKILIRVLRAEFRLNSLILKHKANTSMVENYLHGGRVARP
jgi:hypothetical protein